MDARTVYYDGSDRAIMERWLVHGAGYAWSGGSPSGSFTDSKGPDASRELVRFFELPLGAPGHRLLADRVTRHPHCR